MSNNDKQQSSPNNTKIGTVTEGVIIDQNDQTAYKKWLESERGFLLEHNEKLNQTAKEKAEVARKANKR